MLKKQRAAILVLSSIASGLGFASSTRAETAPSVQHCAEIGAPADRLACYDALAGRSPAAAQAKSEAIAAPAAMAPASAASTPPPSTSLLAPAMTPANELGDKSPSLLSRYWELDPADKRGIFNFVGYQPNYVLPIHVTNRINRAPQSPTQTAVALPDYRKDEAEFQLSLRTKVAQNIGFPGADVWLAFTQKAFWQIYNGADSKPFRNTDYEPEALYVIPTPASWRALPFQWQWRYTQLGLAHQSNGQSDPLSRSWNRVFLETGFERGDWSLIAHWNQRLNEPITSDNNPDLIQYRGRYEFTLNWAHELQTASLLYRSSLTDAKYGALQLQWTYPVFRDQPNGLRYFAQIFSGFGETLTDYNFRQTSVGLGFSFLQF